MPLIFQNSTSKHFEILHSLYNQYQLNVNTNQASIDYSFSSSSGVAYYNYTGASNMLTVSCHNGGKMDGDFYLTVDFVNATFSTETQQPYQVNSPTSTDFRWILHSGDSGSKQVYFSIDPNVSGFSATVNIHSNQNQLKPNAVYPCSVQYTWNPTYNCFKQA